MAIAMATTTEDFPRSDGIRHSNNKSEARGSFVTDDDQLFKRKKRSANSSNKQAAKLSKKKKLLARKSAATAAPTKLSKVVIESMTLSRLVEGLTIYGCIQEIDDFEIKFSITGGIVVKVPITNISSPYAKLIEEFASDVTGGISEIAKLNAIFEVGEYYPVKVLSKTVCDQFGHTEIIGSINPKDIYSHFTVKSLNNVPDGYNLLAAVSSLEDYGYEMDIGVAGVKAFLPLEDLKKNCQQSRLNIGQLVPCSLLQKNERSIILTTSKKLANVSLDLTDEPSVYSYVPGTRTKCLVTEVHNSGLELSLPGGYTGFVSRYHISDDIAALPKKFKIGDTVEGHVLYVQPHTKQICICLKSKLSKKAVKNLISTIRLGLVIEGAVICGVGEFGRTIFKLPSNNFAIALRKNLCDQAEYEALKLKGHFSIGSSHVCRVKQFHLFDNLIEISLKKSFIERKELSPDDLAVGAIVEGTIKKFKANGIYVRLGFGLNGFIPNMHLIDAPYVNLGKNRDKMFAEKKRIKCRITRLDTNSKVPKISLTVKKTLLAMKDSDIFADFSQIRPGMSSTGVVCLITEKGVLLEFFGRVSGFIPLKFLATYKIDHPEKVFAIGQLIKCTVVSVDAQAQRMVCSLIDVSETKKLKIQTSLVPSKLQNSSLKVGQILRKLKIISKSAMKGFDLTNDKQNIQVFLSLAHLSDDTHISRLLFSAFKVGDTIEQVMVFSVDSANVVTVTRKSAFLSNKDCLVTSEDDIQLNQPFPAIVRNVTHNGVFFETPNAHFGVIRRKLLQDGFYEEPHKLGLVRGQTVFVTAVDLVLHLDESEENGGSTSTSNSNTSNLKRFKFSMKLSDVWNRESEARVATVKTYLEDYSLALQLFKSKASDDSSATSQPNSFQSMMNKFIAYSIGQVVTYVVTNVADDSIEVKISQTGSKNESTVPGLAVKYADFGDLSVSHMGNAIVCDFDLERKVLLVFIQPQPAKLVRQVKNSQKSNFVKNIKTGQSIKGTVIYIGKRYVLASLSGHAPGVVAYIPSKRHQNDLGQIEQLFTVGEDYHFVVKNIDQSDRVIAILNVHNKQKQKAARNKTKPTQPAVDEPKKPANEEISRLNSASTTRSSNVKVASKTTNLESQNQFQWDIPDLTPNLSKKRKHDNESSTSQQQEEDDDLENLLADSDSDVDDDGLSSKKRRKTREERNEEARQRELELRQKELELGNTERTPQDEKDFEMAVMASPNSSLVWLKYMSFFLEKGDTAQARALAERALQRISFREEKEKLNIWIGLMNLENTYGDQASMDELVERAIKYNDPKAIYLQLASIYDNSNKKEKAEQIYHLAIKKFKQDKSTWMEFLAFYMQNGRLESARKLFQKSLLSLEKRDHVDIISKFAQLEFRYGDSEQAKTIFESMLATYWKRLDQWSVYIDMLVKYTLEESNLDSVEFVRNIFERLITFKLPPQKMKFIFKKYYDFESKFSSENFETLDRIKQKALEYIESDIF